MVSRIIKPGLISILALTMMLTMLSCANITENSLNSESLPEKNEAAQKKFTYYYYDFETPDFSQLHDAGDLETFVSKLDNKETRGVELIVFVKLGEDKNASFAEILNSFPEEYGLDDKSAENGDYTYTTGISNDAVFFYCFSSYQILSEKYMSTLLRMANDEKVSEIRFTPYLTPMEQPDD